MQPTRVDIDVALPFPGQAVVDFLATRAVETVEYADGSRYGRSLRLEHGPAVVEVEAGRDSLTATVTADPQDVDAATDACSLIFDADADPVAIDKHLAADAVLGRSVAERPGLRVPGLPDGFEAAVRAIVGQQVSVAGAATILSRLAARYGDSTGYAALPRLFPTAAALAGVDPESLPMPRSRGRCLVEVARAVAAGSLLLRPRHNLEETREALLAVRGIGAWTADYIAMRALRDPDVFLPTDLGVRHGLARLGADPSRAADLARRWRPWRSYALMHVWAAPAGRSA